MYQCSKKTYHKYNSAQYSLETNCQLPVIIIYLNNQIIPLSLPQTSSKLYPYPYPLLTLRHRTIPTLQPSNPHEPHLPQIFYTKKIIKSK